MKAESLSFYFQRARKEKWALPHFNFATLEQLRGIVEAAKEKKAPVMVGTAEGERTFVGARQAVALVRSFREEFDIPVFLNSDHCRSFESAKEALDAGYDSVHIDLSKESLEQNIKETQRFVEYAKSKNPQVHTEGELGYLVTESSKMHKGKIEIPEESLTRVEEAVRFCKETGVDRLAPALGTIHGIAEDMPYAEKLHLDLIEQLRAAVPQEIVLVLHGGSGVHKEDIQSAIEKGITNIHISTELRIVFAESLRRSLKEQPDELAPYRYLKDPVAAVKELVLQELSLFRTPAVS